MKNSEIKPLFKETIPDILKGNYDRSEELASLLEKYTWSYSYLSNLSKKDKKTGREFLYSLTEDFEQTDSQLFGDLVHRLCLNQSMSDLHFEKLPRTSKANKEKRMSLELEGKTIVDPKYLDAANQCMDSMRCNDDINEILESKGEEEKWIQSELNGFKVGGIVDKILPDKNAEIKTSSSIIEDHFMRSSCDYGYTLQAFLLRYINGKEVVYPIASNKAPYDSVLRTPTDIYYKHGEMLLNQGLEALEQIIDNISNKSLYNKKSLLSIPNWEVNRVEYYFKNN